MNATHMIPIVALAALALAAPASAAGFDFAIDFDTDGDPATIQGTVEASVGDIVEAYLVVDDFPTPWPMLWAALFGLDGTDGLELIGLFGTQPDRGGMLTDGPEGIVVAYTTPFERHELPAFVARFVFRITDGGEQTVKLAPSTGWGVEQSGVVWTVSQDVEAPLVDLTDAVTLATQQVGTIRPREDLPTLPASWSKIKKLYQDDTI